MAEEGGGSKHLLIVIQNTSWVKIWVKAPTPKPTSLAVTATRRIVRYTPAPPLI